MMELTESRPILRYQSGAVSPADDAVVREYSLLLLVNGQEHSRLLCSPAALRELVTGYAFGEGLIAARGDVAELTVDEEAGCARLQLAAPPAIRPGLPILTTGLGPQKSLAYAQEQLLTSAPLAAGFTVAAATVTEFVEELQQGSQLFAATGGVHSCALYDSHRQLAFYDDIGRHNALDKLIGHALLSEIDLSQTLIVTSGRIPGYMVLKCYRAGIPLIVTRAAVTDGAIELARAANLTLIGFARGQRMNIYTGSQRLKF